MEAKDLTREQRKVLCLLADGYWLHIGSDGWRFSPGGAMLDRDTNLGDMIEAGLIYRAGGSNDISITHAGQEMARGLSY